MNGKINFFENYPNSPPPISHQELAHRTKILLKRVSGKLVSNARFMSITVNREINKSLFSQFPTKTYGVNGANLL